ncbi:MAG TPA: hypothetical protein DDZ89_08130 [Clostridiales bacterium]|nr:hypothetical protein [Clostridiales bacterium]
MAVNYRRCPVCGSKNSIKIIYGYPGPEIMEKAQAGELKLGGCCLFGDDPEYYCKDCESQWNKQQALDAAYRRIKVIKASISRYFRDRYNVEINLENRKVTVTYWDGGEEEITRKTIRQTTADKLPEQIKSVNLLFWKRRYVDPLTLDGTQWSAELLSDERTIKIYGSNQYPEEWDAFCRIISKVTGKSFR